MSFLNCFKSSEVHLRNERSSDYNHDHDDDQEIEDEITRMRSEITNV